MKTRYILFSLLGISTVVFAGWYVPWDKTKPPTISLPVAYERALAAMGSATNELHCVGAQVSTVFPGKVGCWDFAFYSTNKPPKTMRVVVDFDGNAHAYVQKDESEFWQVR